MGVVVDERPVEIFLDVSGYKHERDCVKEMCLFGEKIPAHKVKSGFLKVVAANQVIVVRAVVYTYRDQVLQLPSPNLDAPSGAIHSRKKLSTKRNALFFFKFIEFVIESRVLI